jgi:hypothetical protein
MEYFGSLSDIEKYGLLLEFLSNARFRNKGLDIIRIYNLSFDPHTKRIDVNSSLYPTFPVLQDSLEREVALKYVSQTIINKFTYLWEGDQYEFIAKFFYEHNEYDILGYCY